MAESGDSRNVSYLAMPDSEVYLAVRERIRQGDVGANDRLVDTTLAAEFNLSRMPVRQALLRLVHEGYLVGTTRGFVLPRLSQREIEEIFEVRMLLEPRAAASACQSVSAEQVAAFRAAFAEAKKAVECSDAQAMMRANDCFRQIWLEAVPNKRLAATISRFVDHVQIVRSATVVDRDTQEVVLELMARLLAGFERSDALSVHDDMVQFLVRARDIFFARRDGAGAIDPAQASA